MNVKFVAQQKVLGLSECERLCGTWSRDVEELAFQSGWHGTPGDKLSVSVGTALNMLVRSIGKANRVEPGAIGAWLPGLRNEALLKLGIDLANWNVEGTSEVRQHFYMLFSGHPTETRPRIAPILGCCSNTTTRELRFYSQSDVEALSNAGFEQRQSSRIPRFVINAHTLAGQVQAIGGAPLFTVRACQL